MTVGFWMLVGPVVRLVYGDEFEPAIQFAIWLAPIAAIKGIVQGLESYLKGRGQPMITVHLPCGCHSHGHHHCWAVSMDGAYGDYSRIADGQAICVLSLLTVIYMQAARGFGAEDAARKCPRRTDQWYSCLPYTRRADFCGYAD